MVVYKDKEVVVIGSGFVATAGDFEMGWEEDVWLLAVGYVVVGEEKNISSVE